MEETLCHAPAYIPVALEKAFLRDGHAVGNVAGLGAEMASVGVERVCALEAFLGVALVGVHSVRTDRVEAADSLRGHSGCT